MEKTSANIKKFVGISLITLGTLTFLTACGSKESKSLNKAVSLRVLIIKVVKVVVVQILQVQVQVQVLPLRKDLEMFHKFYRAIILP